jgi:hypothetical protein
MNESPVMSQISEGALRGNEPSPTGVNEVPLSPQAPITQYSPQSWMSTPRSIQTNEDDSHVTPMDLNADFLLERGGKKTRTNSKKSKKSRKTRTNSKKSRTNSKKSRTNSKKSRTNSKKTRTNSKKTRTNSKRGGKGFTTSETNGKESQ